MDEEKQGYPYQRILDTLRAEILTGARAPGEQLPSENELAAANSTSRPTVRRALARLKADGLVYSEQGRGVFVRQVPRVRLVLTGSNYRKHRELGLAGFNAQVLEQGQSPEQRLLEVGTADAPPEVAGRLGLEENEVVVVRKRLFLADGQPVSLCDSYYPVELAQAPAILEARRVKGGVHALIEDPAGPIRRRISGSLDSLTSRMPTPYEDGLLRLPPGVPVIRVLRTVYDTEGQPVEVQDTIAAADRHEFRYEVSMAGDRAFQR